MKKNKFTMFRFLKLTFKIHKLYYILLILSSFLSLAMSLLGAYTISLILKYVEIKDLKYCLILGGIIALSEGILTLSKKYIDSRISIHQEIMNQKIDQMIDQKIMSFPFSYLENPYYLSLKENAKMGINNMGAIYSFVNGALSLFTNIITLISLGGIVATFDYRFLLSLGIGFILILVITLLSTKAQVKFYNELLPINFKFGYYINTLSDTRLSKDYRMYDDVYNVLNQDFHKFNNQLNKYFINMEFKYGLMECLISLVRYCSIGFIYIFAGIKAINRTISISSFSLIISSSISFSESVSSLISQSGNFIRSIEYVKPILELMDIKDDVDEGNIELDTIKNIEFDHVSFTYPGTNSKVLDDVTFKFNNNEKISIVGLNGAGKTTIVKLICKLYKPDSGVIKVNGVDINDYSYSSYMKQISSVFQDFKLFNYSIKDNIGPDISEEKAYSLCEEVGLKDKIDSLKYKINTCIGKAYDEEGIELSGGQEQKIAIARALYKESSLLILDEPTASLDPISECEIYENFNSLAKDRMAIYISHRMASSIFCDKILVLNNGKVESFAPHEELMKDHNSLYYKLFKTQAKNYNM